MPDSPPYAPLHPHADAALPGAATWTVAMTNLDLAALQRKLYLTLSKENHPGKRPRSARRKFERFVSQTYGFQTEMFITRANKILAFYIILHLNRRRGRERDGAGHHVKRDPKGFV